MFNEMFINPAYAGSREAMSATLLYRNQWVGLEGAPETQTFSIHGPFVKNKIGLGISLLNESIGVTKQFGAFVNYAYRITMKKGTFAMGLQAGILRHQNEFLDINTVTPGDEQFMANSDKVIGPNAGIGLYYNTSRFYAGLSIPRLLENKIDVANGTDVKNKFNSSYWHYFLSSGYVMSLTGDLKFKPTLMMKIANAAPVEFDVNANFLFNEMFWVGAGYRTGDALSIAASVQLTKQLRIGYSYDYTLTDLNDFSNGTHEITLGYDFVFEKSKVVTPRYF
jgi:type IX secretion system PorP/SprF family membrane protein